MGTASEEYSEAVTVAWLQLASFWCRQLHLLFESVKLASPTQQEDSNFLSFGFGPLSFFIDSVGLSQVEEEDDTEVFTARKIH